MSTIGCRNIEVGAEDCARKCDLYAYRSRGDVMRRSLTLITLVWSQLLGSADVSVAAGKRIALVIGNSDYEHTSSLPNPANDARLMVRVLRTSGFEVLEHINIDLKSMKRAIAELAKRARSYGKDTVVLLYYAGHGVQVSQSNYLIPVDAKIESEGDVAIEGLNAAAVLESLSDAQASVNIIILDACRNNPYRTSFRSATRGLARLDGPTGFLIAFSTDPGRVATDGPVGGNSPYTEFLARELAFPGIKIEDAFKRVRKAVYDATKGAQVPWESSSLMNDLYVAGGEPGRPLNADKLASEIAAARASAALEAERSKHAAAKSEEARQKALSEAERAKAQADRAAIELARARAEAELAKAELEATRLRQKYEAERKHADAQRSYDGTPTTIDPLSLFNPAAAPSFSCPEYGVKPVGHPDRNP